MRNDDPLDEIEYHRALEQLATSMRRIECYIVDCQKKYKQLEAERTKIIYNWNERTRSDDKANSDL